VRRTSGGENPHGIQPERGADRFQALQQRPEALIEVRRGHLRHDAAFLEDPVCALGDHLEADGRDDEHSQA